MLRVGERLTVPARMEFGKAVHARIPVIEKNGPDVLSNPADSAILAAPHPSEALMPRLSLRTSALTAAALALGAATLHAQGNNLTRAYAFKAKPGMFAQLENAIRDHAQWRKANGDPWTWQVYTPETGPDLGLFMIRSSNHSWADFDAYDQGFAQTGLANWNVNVAPLVETSSSSIEMTLPDSLNQTPAEGTAIQFANVTAFHLRPGMEQQFNRLVAQAVGVLKKAKWPGYWVWVTPMSGGPDMDAAVHLAGLFPNWASMKEPDPNFAAVMTRALGQNGFNTWMSSMNETLRGTTEVTYRFRPDLSVLPN